jgi:hypothetical protein
MQTRAGQYVDAAVEQLFEILTEPHDIQQPTVGVHVHQHVNVAVAAVIATRDRAEHAEVARSVPRRYPKDIVTLLLQVHGGIAGSSLETAHRPRITGRVRATMGGCILMTDVRRGRVFAQDDGRVAPKNPRGPAKSLKTKDRRVDERVLRPPTWPSARLINANI